MLQLSPLQNGENNGATHPGRVDDARSHKMALHSTWHIAGAHFIRRHKGEGEPRAHTRTGAGLASGFFHLQVGGAARKDSPSSSGPLLGLREALIFGGREQMRWKRNLIPKSSGLMTVRTRSDIPSSTPLPWTPAPPWERLGLGGLPWPAV